jgi:osmotically-inducible protein OsmY
MKPTRATYRNDAEIFADARLALDDQPAIPGTVRVHVNDGVATLTGTVRHQAERTAAQQTVQAVDGVREVVDLITVWDVRDSDGFDAPER